jgi:hypothetical protein
MELTIDGPVWRNQGHLGVLLAFGVHTCNAAVCQDSNGSSTLDFAYTKGLFRLYPRIKIPSFLFVGSILSVFARVNRVL